VSAGSRPDTGTPALLFDGECGFCTSCAGFIRARLPGTAAVIPWQRANLAEYGVSPDAARTALQWVGADGRVSSGAAAVGRLLLDAGGWWRIPGRLALLPPFSWAAALAYRAVAANRHRMPGGTPACDIQTRTEHEPRP
jgi:predicted DCC family thiol-disulfide oxidoreductase YuxK